MAQPYKTGTTDLDALLDFLALRIAVPNFSEESNTEVDMDQALADFGVPAEALDSTTGVALVLDSKLAGQRLTEAVSDSDNTAAFQQAALQAEVSATPAPPPAGTGDTYQQCVASRYPPVVETFLPRESVCYLPPKPDCGARCCRTITWRLLFGKRKIRLCEPSCKVACEAIGLAYKNPCSLFRIPGEVIYNLGAAVNRVSSTRASLTDQQKDCLRLVLPNDVVDSAVIHFDSKYLGTYNIFGRAFNFSVDAQTFGNRMYFPIPQYKSTYGDRNFLATLLHEMAHVYQWQLRGRNIRRQAQDYFEAWCKSGCSYTYNKLEFEARQFFDRHWDEFGCCMGVFEGR